VHICITLGMCLEVHMPFNAIESQAWCLSTHSSVVIYMTFLFRRFAHTIVTPKTTILEGFLNAHFRVTFQGCGYSIWTTNH
jgi:hypothetical protein